LQHIGGGVRFIGFISSYLAKGSSAKKNGYAYIYFSNESNDVVFFDNFNLTHQAGPLLEETHYYPFGLTMGGVSCKALNNTPENKNDKFQGQPLDDDLGINWYGFRYRNHDPQIGRFIQIDPLSEKYLYNSTYAFSENKVTAHFELEGLESVNANHVNNPLLRAAMRENVQKEMSNMRANGSAAVQVSVSAGAGVGIKFGSGSTKIDVSASGPQAEISMNTGGKVEAKASLAGTNFKGEAGKSSLSAGMNIGVVQISDGNVIVKGTTGGIKADIAGSVESKSGNVTSNLGAGVANATISAGAKLGVVGLEVSVNVLKAGEAVVDFFKAGIAWMSNVVKDMAPKAPKQDFPNK